MPSGQPLTNWYVALSSVQPLAVFGNDMYAVTAYEVPQNNNSIY
jgi:hypothetical protein